ncbi:MAG: NYN domain-containing protein [Chloroflexota bacterium]|nr:NYN domain-containing protein [Chloroflexota bacterium]MDE2684921.1 NYN domain-containing protein [Chloroflexota bacterium]
MDTIVFIDGQNLYHLAKDAWLSGVTYPTPPHAWPSYDVEKIANALVTRQPGRTSTEIRFYTGVPNRPEHPYWHDFWLNKLRYLARRGIYVYQGKVNRGGQEKGVDVSLALDLVQAAHERRYDAAIIVSQDSDFTPAVSLAKQIAASQNRTLAFESAFPVGPGSASRRGIHGTAWVRIDQAMYDACLDPRDYRPARR